nr:AlNc14C48G3839 [Albugo laibachii Nc14]|eukprot:CCA18300.1 AlNc14C48G3839 [Albugo laibachii Nc14]
MASSHLHIEEESAKVNIETILTNARVIVEEDRDLAPVEPVELNEATDPKIATVPSILPAKQMLRIDQAIERAQVEVENVSSTPVGLLAAIKMTGVADTTRLTVVEDQGTAPARIDPTRLLASADIGAQAAKRNENIGKECIGKDQESCIW